MDWSKQELEKIEAVMKHLNEIIYITNDLHHERHFCEA